MQTLTAQPSRTEHLAALASTIPGRILIGLSATLVVAAAAHVSILLPFTPVPLTLQPLAVLGVGLALGPVDGFLTMLAYLAEGAAGLPVFSPTGPGGLLQLFGATGGFLMAYPFVAAIVGSLTRGLRKALPTFFAALIACTVATAFLFCSGAGWLIQLTHISLLQAWIAAVAPFLPAEAGKILVAAATFAAVAHSKRIEQ